jgi:hypothetical protein
LWFPPMPATGAPKRIKQANPEHRALGTWVQVPGLRAILAFKALGTWA